MVFVRRMAQLELMQERDSAVAGRSADAAEWLQELADENNYTDALLLLVWSNCVVTFVARRMAHLELMQERDSAVAGRQSDAAEWLQERKEMKARCSLLEQG
jgi:hypothetical protein